MMALACGAILVSARLSRSNLPQDVRDARLFLSPGLKLLQAVF